MARPLVVVSARGVDRLRSGHPWIYRSDIQSSDADSGALVRVETERGRPIGSGVWSSASQIALRYLGADDIPDGADAERALVRDRARAALAFRESLQIDGTAWRAINGEADRLPGLIVDVYGESPERVVVIQTLTQATDRLLPGISDVRAELLSAKGVLARNDPKVRRLEGLPETVFVTHGEVPEQISVREGSIEYIVDVRRGQKTGLFLDQRENHAMATTYARGRGLDAFSYHGGFALRLAQRCERVTALDSSAPAVAEIVAGAARNGLTNIDAREVNVFDELRELEIARERFNTIVLDPPAFAKNKASVERAAAGYKEINLRALKLLEPGGHLITCSCSYNVNEDLFHAILEQAAIDARATVSLVDKRAQARDHPVLLNVPETHYLKCFVLRKLA